MLRRQINSDDVLQTFPSYHNIIYAIVIFYKVYIKHVLPLFWTQDYILLYFLYQIIVIYISFYKNTVILYTVNTINDCIVHVYTL
mgnify:CR=1 FL=1